ncbi:MAG: GNAT family N-acetyltransferase [Acidobacteriota bacterium]
MRPPGNIETSRLKLRPPIIEDAESIFDRYAQDILVTRYLTWRPHSSILETQNFLRRCISAWADGSAFPWALIRKQDEQLIGMAEIRIDRFKADIGYVLARPEWGKGYVPEAMKEVVDWAMRQEEIYRVWAVCDVENLASARVLEKIGMKREGLLSRWIMHPNISKEPRDCYCYSIAK